MDIILRRSWRVAGKVGKLGMTMSLHQNRWRLAKKKIFKELQCFICFGLLKEAAFLPCNHCFCYSCILKSWKEKSTCPLCKSPATRRELRASPHMDSFVIIYKGMKNSNRLKGSRMLLSPKKWHKTDALVVDLTKGCPSGDSATLQKKKNHQKEADDSSRGCSIINRDVTSSKKRVQVPSLGSIEKELYAIYNDCMQDGVAELVQACKFADPSVSAVKANKEHRGSLNQCALDNHKRPDLNITVDYLKENLGHELFEHSLCTLETTSFSKPDSDASLQIWRRDNFRASEGLPAKDDQSAQLEMCSDGRNLEPFFGLNEQNLEEDGTQLLDATLSEMTLIQCCIVSDLKNSEYNDDVVKDRVSKHSSNVEIKGTPSTYSPRLNSSHLEATYDLVSSIPGTERCLSELEDPFFDLRREIEPCCNLKSFKRPRKCKSSALEDSLQEETKAIWEERPAHYNIQDLTTSEGDSSHVVIKIQGQDLNLLSGPRNNRKKIDLSQSVPFEKPNPQQEATYDMVREIEPCCNLKSFKRLRKCKSSVLEDSLQEESKAIWEERPICFDIQGLTTTEGAARRNQHKRRDCSHVVMKIHGGDLKLESSPRYNKKKKGLSQLVPFEDSDPQEIRKECNSGAFQDLASEHSSKVEIKDTDLFDGTQHPYSRTQNSSHLEATYDMVSSISGTERCILELEDGFFNLHREIEPSCNSKSFKRLRRCKSSAVEDFLHEETKAIEEEKPICLKILGRDLKLESSPRNNRKKKGLSQLGHVENPNPQKIRMECNNVSHLTPADMHNEAATIASRQAPVTIIPHSESPAHQPTCAFCQLSGDSKVAGCMMEYSDGALVVTSADTPSTKLTVHELCAEWAPEVYFADNKVHNLPAEVSRSLRLKCSRCGKKGAALGCVLEHCPKSFHYPCAKALQKCKWDLANFIMICEDHKYYSYSQKQDGDNVVKSKEHSRQPCKLPRGKKEDIDKFEKDTNHTRLPSSPTTFKWLPGPHRQWILSGSTLDFEAKGELAFFAFCSGATIVNTYTSAITHVIIATNKYGAAYRTFKSMMGTLEGKWILKVDWLKACLAAGKAVEEEPFEVHGDIHGIVEGPKRGRAFVANQAPRLFEGIRFYIAGPFDAALKEDMQSLIKTGGGTILEKRPSAEEPETRRKLSSKSKQEHKVSMFVIYNSDPSCNGSREDKRRAVEKQYRNACRIAENAYEETIVLSQGWIFNSIAGWKLEPFY